ncbi:MAG: hypothetical protein ABII00_00735 [Elusimicrobiota bacterium]
MRADRSRAVSLIFFLSGATSLLYEVLWAKHLALTLGSTAAAQTFVLAAFLGGLAAGNAFFGPRADRSPDPLILYAKLEFGIALLAAASPWLLRVVGQLPGPLRAGGGALVLLAPAALMGGTLPALSRWIAPTLERMREGVSWLYFLNSAGAAAGAALAGMLLIPLLGLRTPILLGAATNLGIGAAALWLASPKRGASCPHDSHPADDAEPLPVGGRTPASVGILCAAVFLSGFVSLCYEIGWIRLLALALGSSAYAFSLMLTAFIAGIALGSLLVGRRALARWDPALLFALSELGAAVSIILTWPLFERLPYFALRLASALPRTPANFCLYTVSQFLFCLLLMLLPTVFLGATLPLASRAVTRTASRIASGVGAVFALNTLGNVLGAFAASLLLLPLLGIKGLFQAGMAVNLLVGAAVLWRSGAWAAPRKASVIASAAAAFLLHAAFSAPLDRLVLSSGAFRRDAPPGLTYAAFRKALARDTVLFYADDREASVSVTRAPDGALYLKVNGKTDASSGEDMTTQALLAHLPLVLRPGAEDVLIIGLGSGVTAGTALLHPVRRLDVVEISRAVVAAEALFRPVNHEPLADGRLRLHVTDAKTFLRDAGRRYDAIISEPSNPWIAGMGALFSVDFYRQARARLEPGGVMVQWFHLYEMSDEVLRLVLRTFSAAFERVTLWNVSSNDILLVGSAAPLVTEEAPAGTGRPSREFQRMAAAFARPKALEDLRSIGIGDLTTLLSLQSASDATVRRAAGEGPLNEDLFPRLEYKAPVALFVDSTSRLLEAHDERLKPAAGSSPYLTRHLLERGRPLTREELRNLAAFHGRYGGAVHRAVLREWGRRYTGRPGPKEERP